MQYSYLDIAGLLKQELSKGEEKFLKNGSSYCNTNVVFTGVNIDF